MSTSSGTGGILSNGHRVGEEAEYQTRQIIINMTNDAEEKYRSAGVLTLFRCQNIIIRNLKFVGPGSIDVGGSDLLSCRASKNCWIDHCDFTDGMDGNFDITQSSDFNTVSWCTFSYTERSYMHQNTNLIGYSDREPTGFLNTTFAFNWWGPGCVQRMPMVRVGKIHMLNNYFSCTTQLFRERCQEILQSERCRCRHLDRHQFCRGEKQNGATRIHRRTRHRSLRIYDSALC